MPKIENAVVVITGASSGIGRATALAFAARGATVVVTARREKALQDVAEACRSMGVQSMAIPTDIAIEEHVQALAQRVIDAYGKIDVWVNCAAVLAIGRLEEMPYHVIRRVIETNLFGYINGARAVIPCFRRQGHGVLINVSSVSGKTAQPYTAAYSASKFAINGFSESLREELHDVPNVHVCVVLPASVDTPIFQHAANFSGRAIQPIPPIYDAEDVAAAIVQAAEHPRREIPIGAAGRMLNALPRLTPALAEKFMAMQTERNHFQNQPAPHGEGNLFVPTEEASDISGGWKSQQQVSRGRASRLVPAAAVVGLVALGAGAYSLTRLRSNGR